MKGGLVMALYVIRALLENGWQETDMTVYCAVMKKCHILLLMRWHSSKKRAQGRMLFLILEFGRVDGSVVTGRKGTTRANAGSRGDRFTCGE